MPAPTWLQVWRKIVAASKVPIVLTPGATVTPNFALGDNFTWAIDQNSLLANPTNQIAGQFGYIRITQDATARILLFGANWKFAGGTPSISTAAGAVDVIAYDVVSDGVIQAALIKDFK